MSSQPFSNTITIRSKLTTLFLVVAVLPFLMLLAGLAIGKYQTIFVVGAMVCQVVGLLIGWRFGSKVTKQARTIHETLMKIGQGDFEARSEIATTDELGASAQELNALCDGTLSLIQSREEREQVQNSIQNLKSEMKQIASGNLGISADVKEDMTGAIAESVNQMTGQLRSIVGQVTASATKANKYSSGMHDICESNLAECETQSQLIQNAVEQVLAITESFQTVASMTQDTALVAVETKQSATKGQKAVFATVEGMNRIRNQVQNTSKRIKRLGESSQEIDEIVQLISEITDRTSVLALNASIQASMAGDAGHGFAVIAQEIERLAERSNNATLQISKLIRSVQNETSEVIADMDESTREVVAGSQLASQAGEKLFEIDSVASQLVELIESSSNYALQQARQATSFTDLMSDLSRATKRSAEESRKTTQAAGLLDNMVRKLGDSLSQFNVSPANEIVEVQSFAADNKPAGKSRQPIPTRQAQLSPRSEKKQVELQREQSQGAVALKEKMKSVTQQQPPQQKKPVVKTLSDLIIQPQQEPVEKDNSLASESNTQTKKREKSAAQRPAPTIISSGADQTAARDGREQNAMEDRLLEQAKEMLKEMKKEQAADSVGDSKQDSAGRSSTSVNKTLFSE